MFDIPCASPARRFRAFIQAALFILLAGSWGGAAGSGARAAGSVPKPGPAREAYEKCKRSAVLIEIQLPNTPRRVRGAGLVISKTGYVITNRHVIEAKGPRRVVFFDGKSYRFRVVAAARDLDLAILKIEADRTFKAIGLGRSSEVKAGDPVFAIGNPGGKGLTISQGKVTGIGSGWTWGGPYSDKMIAFDAAIAGGNSGGPIVNERGEAVGVVFCVAIGFGVENLSFAVPMDGTMEFLQRTLAEEGHFFFELGMDVPAAGDGTVSRVKAKSPAEAAGVRPGDRITVIDGVRVKRGFDVHVALIGRRGGDSVALSLVRGRKRIKSTLRLGKIKPRPAAKVASTAPGLKREYYDGDWNQLPDFDRLKPVRSGVANSIGVGRYRGKDHFGLRFTGYVKAPVEGTYRFYLSSDDGSRLQIGDRIMVSNDGLHAVRERRARPLQLAAGLHPITLTYFEKAGDEALKLTWQGPGFEPREVPAAALFHAPSGQ